MRLLALGAVAALLAVQARPNFSGTWTLASTDSPAAAGGVPSVVVVLTQTDSTLTLANGDQKMVFPLDGSDVTTKTQGGASQDLIIRTRWEGARLVVEQLTAVSSVTTTVSLSADGTQLTVATKAKTPQGEGGEKQVFKKSR